MTRTLKCRNQDSTHFFMETKYETEKELLENIEMIENTYGCIVLYGDSLEEYTIIYKGRRSRLYPYRTEGYRLEEVVDSFEKQGFKVIGWVKTSDIQLRGNVK